MAPTKNLRQAARAYAIWRSWRDRIVAINRAITQEEIKAIVDANDGGLETFCLRYGFY